MATKTILTHIRMLNIFCSILLLSSRPNKLFPLGPSIAVHALLPHVSRYDIFHFTSSNSFQTGCRCLASFTTSTVSSPKQAAAVFTPAFIPAIFYPLPRGPTILDPIPPSFCVYKASPAH